MVDRVGLEPTTSALSERHSNQLSYPSINGAPHRIRTCTKLGLNQPPLPIGLMTHMVWVVRFERTTPSAQTRRSAKLSYTQTIARHNPCTQRTSPGVPALNAIGGGPLYSINAGDLE